MISLALASFTITWVDESSTAGTATYVETVNFDLATGLRIPFDSVFADADAALEAISAESRKQLQAQLGTAYDATIAADGTVATRASFVNWAVTSGGIKVTFAEYQVSRAAGLVSVEIPWGSLRSFMYATGPVALLAGLGT